MIIAVAGSGWVFGIDAGSFLFSVVFVTAMRVAPHARPVAQRFWSDLADGWHEVRGHRWLTAGFLGYAVGNIGVGAYVVVGSHVAFRELGGAWAWGLIGGASAVGGTLGGFIAYRFRPQHPVAAAFGIWTLCALPPLALIRPLPLPAVMVAGLIFGGSILVGNTLWETAMQQEVRPDRLARVASIDALLSICLMPLGQILAGPVSAALGVRATLLLAAALMAVPNLAVVAFVREVRHVERRDEAALSAVCRTAGAASRSPGMKSTRRVQCGSHQFASPSSFISAGTSSARITVASKMIPAARPIANSLISKPGLEERTRNANMRISAALVTSFPVRARPSSIARSVEPRLVVCLAHAREHEDLVVHREAEQEREDHQRDPGRDRLGRGDVPERRAVTHLEDEDDDPERAAERDEVEDRRLDRQHDRPERPRQQDEREDRARTRGRTGSSRRRRG